MSVVVVDSHALLPVLLWLVVLAILMVTQHTAVLAAAGCALLLHTVAQL
jgi:hypothetical protein